MNLPPKNHRERSKDHNFLMESRFIFWGPSPEAQGGNEAASQSADSQTQDTPQTPFTATHWNDHQARFDAHLKIFSEHGNDGGGGKEKNQAFVNKKNKKFLKKIRNLKITYDRHLVSLSTRAKSEQHEGAAKKVENDVNKLLTNIKSHIHEDHHDKVHEDLRDRIKDDAENALDKVGIKKDEVTIHFTYKDLVKENLTSFRSGDGPEFIKLKNPPVYVKFNKSVTKSLKKPLNTIVDATKIPKEKLQKTIKEIEAEEEAATQKTESASETVEKPTEEQVLIEEAADKLGIKGLGKDTYLNKLFAKHLKFTKEGNKYLMNGTEVNEDSFNMIIPIVGQDGKLTETKINIRTMEPQELKKLEAQLKNEAIKNKPRKLSASEADKAIDQVKGIFKGVDKTSMKKFASQKLNLSSSAQSALVGMFEADDFDNAQFLEGLKKDLMSVSLHPSKIQEIKEGKMEAIVLVLAQATLNKFKTIKINKYTKEKGEALSKLLQKNDLFKEIKNIKAKKAIQEMFNNADDPAVKYLVMRYKFENKDGKLMIGDGKEMKPIEDIKHLKKYLPIILQGKFNKLYNLPANSEENVDDLVKDFNSKMEASVKVTENIDEIKQQLEAYMKRLMGQESATDGSGETMSTKDAMTQFFELLAMFYKALKDGDFDTLSSLVSDMSEGGPEQIMKGVKDSKKAYEKVFTDLKPNETSFDQLISAYDKPDGKHGDALFLGGIPKSKQDKHPLNKYRAKFAKPKIKDYLRDKLNLKDISAINNTSDESKHIEGTKKDGKKIQIYITIKGGEPHVKLGEKDNDAAKEKLRNLGKRTLAQVGKELGYRPEGSEAAELSPDQLREKIDQISNNDLKDFKGKMRSAKLWKTYSPKFVRQFRKQNPKASKYACRKAFLKANIDNKDVQAYVKSKIGGATPGRAPDAQRRVPRRNHLTLSQAKKAGVILKYQDKWATKDGYEFVDSNPESTNFAVRPALKRPDNLRGIFVDKARAIRSGYLKPDGKLYPGRERIAKDGDADFDTNFATRPTVKKAVRKNPRVKAVMALLKSRGLTTKQQNTIKNYIFNINSKFDINNNAHKKMILKAIVKPMTDNYIKKLYPKLNNRKNQIRLVQISAIVTKQLKKDIDDKLVNNLLKTTVQKRVDQAINKFRP